PVHSPRDRHRRRPRPRTAQCDGRHRHRGVSTLRAARAGPRALASRARVRGGGARAGRSRSPDSGAPSAAPPDLARGRGVQPGRRRQDPGHRRAELSRARDAAADGRLGKHAGDGAAVRRPPAARGAPAGPRDLPRRPRAEPRRGRAPRSPRSAHATGVNVEHHTFSIAGHCVRTGAFGVAVSTARPALDAAGPLGGPDGALAAQATTNTSLGRDGVRRLADGIPITEALATLLRDDPLDRRRQVHGVDRRGAWAHTGADCKPWCGHRVEAGFTVAGNFLTGPDVLDAMATAFAYDPSAELGHRFVSALEAGQAAARPSPPPPSAPLP